MTAPINFRPKCGGTVQHAVRISQMPAEKSCSINDMVMLLTSYLLQSWALRAWTPDLLLAPAARSLQNICVKITQGTVQELKSDMVITSPHSSVSEFLNNVPSEACMSILRKAEIILACVQNGTVI